MGRLATKTTLLLAPPPEPDNRVEARDVELGVAPPELVTPELGRVRTHKLPAKENKAIKRDGRLGQDV